MALFVALFTGLAASPAFAEDGLNHAILLYNQRDYRTAAQTFHKLSQGPQAATASYYLGLCYQNMNCRDQSTAVFTHICKFYPNSPEAKNASLILQRAVTLKQDSAAGEPPMLTRTEWAKLPNKVRIPIAREHGHLMVTAKINGHLCKVAFDTGASKCGISILDYPQVFSDGELASAKTMVVMRPAGPSQMRVCAADIGLQELNRKVETLATLESGISVIGQNFFKEYSYEIDPFYIRLTKSPYPGDQALRTAQATTLNVSANSQSKNRYDKFTLPFEKYHDCMLVEIEMNGQKTKAMFDTGCAAEGVVCKPSDVARYSMKHAGFMTNRLDRLVVGPMIKMDVRVDFAGGLIHPLIGPKVFDRPFKVDQQLQIIKFDY